MRQTASLWTDWRWGDRSVPVVISSAHPDCAGPHLSERTIMAASEPETEKHIILCLVADEQVIDRFPAAVRYLQVGIIDEPISVVLVVPDHPRADDLVSGPTKMIRHRLMSSWPLGRWAMRGVIADVLRHLDSLDQSATVIVHGLALSVVPLAAAIAEAVDCEFVLNVASTNALDDRNLMRWMDRASAIVTPAEAIRRAVGASPLASKAAEIVPLGVMCDRAPSGFNQSENDPVLLFVGALTAEAGADALLRAAKQTLRTHPNLRLFILGRGPAEASLRHLAAALDISAQVTFTGRIEHMRAAMRASDIFCMPAALTAFREEPIHALASGMAVVAAEGVYCDGLVHRQTALRFPDGDEHAMADRFDTLLDDPEAARVLAATGQAYARSHHAVSRMVADYVRIYRKLAGRHDSLPMPGGG